MKTTVQLYNKFKIPPPCEDCSVDTVDVGRTFSLADSDTKKVNGSSQRQSVKYAKICKENKRLFKWIKNTKTLELLLTMLYNMHTIISALGLAESMSIYPKQHKNMTLNAKNVKLRVQRFEIEND